MQLFNIGTFNVRGLNDPQKQEHLRRDAEIFKMDVVALQETKMRVGTDTNLGKSRLIVHSTTDHNHGTGFIVAPKWAHAVYKTWRVSNRLSVLQLELNHREDRIQRYTCKVNRSRRRPGVVISKAKRRDLITIINVYAPTADLVKKDEKEITEMYASIDSLMEEFKQNIIFIVGDFNARIGKSQGEHCIGRFSKGKRNEPGQRMVDFCTLHDLFIANSAFQHPAKHITTWEQHRSNNTQTGMITIRSQIDYVLCSRPLKHILIDARSHSGTLTDSDHRLIKCRTDITPYHRYKRPDKPAQKKQFDCARLKEASVRAQYQLEIRRLRSQQLTQPANNEDMWDRVKVMINESAEKTVGYRQNRVRDRKYNAEVQKLSDQQKDLRVQITACQDVDKVRGLKHQRNQILARIKKKNLDLKERDILAKIAIINDSKDTAKTFKAIRELSRKPAENPYVHDAKGRHITQPNAIYKTVRAHFNDHFNDPDQPMLEQFRTPPAPLTKPITPAEVAEGAKRLNNNRAAGYDNITAELLKYAPAEVYVDTATVLNKCFTHNEGIQVSKGLLVALPKPGKPKGPLKNLRPVILLPIIRKVLSILVLVRIKDRVEEYLSASQAAYREKRSTTDIVCCHRWIGARVQKRQERVYITGIDMSSAFDTIRRKKLIEIFATFLEEDEVRLIQFLLADTTLDIKMHGVSDPQPFSTNMGSPQGDALSGMCFNVYFENALKKLRAAMKADPILDEHSYSCRSTEVSLPEECIYADDYDFITDTIEQRDKLNNIVRDILLEENLLVNESKTENIIVERHKRTKDKEVVDEPWRLATKLGSKLGDSEDIAQRKLRANTTLHTIEKSWYRGDHVKQSVKLQTYKTMVKPILTYNGGTWGMTAQDEQGLNSFHRQQLRKVLNVKWPRRMSNKNVYKLTGETPLSLQLLSARWRLFGHCLRLPQDTPVQKAVRHYFTPSSSPGFRGRARITLPVTLHNDIYTACTGTRLLIRRNTSTGQYSIDGPLGIRGLQTSHELAKLQALAGNRTDWNQLVKAIYDAAEGRLAAA
jgi:exonuclease III